jgi:hypothetical protein
LADIEHNVIADPELHEPKGVAIATARQVYAADGGGGGDWIFTNPSSTVIIESASDFPTAVAGVRTLVANTTYHIVGSVSIDSDTLVLGTNVVLRGNNQSVDKIVTTSTGTLITATSTSFRFYKIGFTCLSGTFMAVSGSSNSHSLREVSVSCDVFGTVAGNRLTDMWRSRVQCVTDGLTFSGACFRFIMDNATIDVTGGANTCVDFGVATFDNIRIHASSINNASGVNGLDIAAAGANLNTGAEAFLVLTDFLTSATAVTGFVRGDPNWTMQNNIGLANNRASAQGSILASALTTTFSGTGGGNDVLVNFGTAFISDTEAKFTISTAGAFTYDAINNLPVQVLADVSIFAEIAGGATREYNWYLALNGTLIASSVSKHEYDGTNPGTVSVKTLIDIVPGDTITLRVRAETATTAITANTVSITIVEA